jgi:hypothetical protein
VFTQILVSQCRHFYFRYFRYSIVDHFHRAPYGFSRTFLVTNLTVLYLIQIVSISPVTEFKSIPLSLFSSFQEFSVSFISSLSPKRRLPRIIFNVSKEYVIYNTCSRLVHARFNVCNIYRWRIIPITHPGWLNSHVMWCKYYHLCTMSFKLLTIGLAF